VETLTEKSVVRVVFATTTEDGRVSDVLSSSGFVVAPGLVVTTALPFNLPARRPVVFVQQDAKVGTPRLQATLQTRLRDFDLVLLRVDGLTAPPIPVSNVAVVAGMPVRALGLRVEQDQSTARDDEVPQIANGFYSIEGTVSLVAKSSAIAKSSVVGGSGTSVIFHTAKIDVGNSGGPLTDTCGRVVGVNTLRSGVTTASGAIEPPRGAAVATPVGDVLTLLKLEDVTPKIDIRRCDGGTLIDPVAIAHPPLVQPGAPAPSTHGAINSIGLSRQALDTYFGEFHGLVGKIGAAGNRMVFPLIVQLLFTFLIFLIALGFYCPEGQEVRETANDLLQKLLNVVGLTFRLIRESILALAKDPKGIAGPITLAAVTAGVIYLITFVVGPLLHMLGAI
jgi:hypothetical protein